MGCPWRSGIPIPRPSRVSRSLLQSWKYFLGGGMVFEGMGCHGNSFYKQRLTPKCGNSSYWKEKGSTEWDTHLALTYPGHLRRRSSHRRRRPDSRFGWSWSAGRGTCSGSRWSARESAASAGHSPWRSHPWGWNLKYWNIIQEILLRIKISYSARTRILRMSSSSTKFG